MSTNNYQYGIKCSDAYNYICNLITIKIKLNGVQLHHLSIESLYSFLSVTGPKQRRIELAHSQDDIIYDRLKYKCHSCAKEFSREAALKRHVEFVHTKQYLDSDEEADADAKVGDESGGDDAEEEYRTPKPHNKSPRCYGDHILICIFYTQMVNVHNQ